MPVEPGGGWRETNESQTMGYEAHSHRQCGRLNLGLDTILGRDIASVKAQGRAVQCCSWITQERAMCADT